MRKTLTQGIKKVILEYVMSSLKFPLHLYNAVAIKQQFPASENRLQSTLCYQMLLRTSGVPSGHRRAALSAVQPQGRDGPNSPRWQWDGESPRPCPGCARRAGGAKARPLLQKRAPRRNLQRGCFSPEKWSAWEWGRCSHPGCWHGAPHLCCLGYESCLAERY